MSRSLLKSTGLVGLMTLLSRVLGLVREIMLASKFGAGGGMDAFLVALMIPNFGRRMFAEGAFSQAFVPVFTEVKTTGSHDDARDMVAVVAGTLGGVLSVITVLGCMAAPLLVWAFASGFAVDPDKAALSAQLLRWTFPYLMFISLTSMAGGVLNAYGHFGVPAFTPVILNVCLIASAFIDSGSVQALAWAVFAAGILQFLFQWPSLLRLRLLPRPRWGWRDPRVRRIVSLMVPVLIGSSVAQISLLLNTNLSTHLGDGPVSWLYYANRLMEFPLGIFSIAIGTAILPTLSAQHALRSTEDFSATLDWSLRLMLVIGLPAAVGMVVLAGPLVATVYGYGRFQASDITMTAYALWAYGVGFIGFSLIKVLTPGFYARQNTRQPVRYAMIGLAVGMTVSVILFVLARHYDVAFGHVGLAASTSITAWVNAMLLLRRLRRDAVYLPGIAWRRFGLQLLAANLVLALVAFSFAGAPQWWSEASAAMRALRSAALIGAGIFVYFGTLAMTGVRPRHFRRQVVAQ
ncbi:murein biosynthesis integral membrane protein MurJ [Sinimarinibacterium sp. CAU 1509]|uniref:murein biosynthesis integral membrane protein MurJ n=1 Tax=Sinimarinibacterium sp. CAU 1509 TaxID=2562283 RepID=UPI0010ACBABF|nr:murein biosynthesis integral membrane protein MurJ [Sinimarinibacterium sp. CAU 1509]TJY62066.1 murein biosynthesis integral membrane protein MurJ [Sinimarinibacterium sp. CAU 1509]